MTEPLHILSLGAGVQSSALALMAAAGEVTPMPMCAIFADTGDEPQSVYRWLDWITPQLPFPVYRVQNKKGKLSAEAIEVKTNQTTGKKYYANMIPAFSPTKGGSAILPRHCTYQFKVLPILRAARLIGNIKRGQKTIGIIQWLGISKDEAHRMKPSREPWCENRWPLIEMGLRRSDCLRWMKAKGFPPPPRSACVYCPFRSDAEWLRLKTDEPEEFKKAAEFEQRLRETHAAITTPGKNVRLPYLHRSLKILTDVDFTDNQLDMGFGNECEGLCGV